MTQWPPYDPNQPNQPGGYPPPPGGYPPPPPLGYYGAPVPGGQLAGMGSRFGALVLDTLILAVPIVLLAVVFGVFDSHNVKCTETAYSYSCHAGISGGKAAAYYLIAFAVELGYFGWTKGVRGQSFGQMATSIRVVDANTGQPIGFGRAVGRTVIMLLGGALCTIGYWSPFFDSQRRQGWHDKSVNSVVIPAPKH